MSLLRIALAQINPTVGDIAANAACIRKRTEEARAHGADIVAFPELAVCGYPPEDLLLKTAFAEANRCAIEQLAKETRGITSIVGFVDRDTDLYNAAAVLNDGEIVAVYRKQRLPNYGVFDELRYFKPGRGETLLGFGDAWVGISICEDIWFPGGPVGRLALAGADLVININASPYHRGKWQRRHQLLATRAVDYGIGIAYVNQLGGQDELVFDGDSMVYDASGELLAEAEPFREQMLYCDFETDQAFRARLHDPRRRQIRDRRHARVMRVALKDNAPVRERVELTPATHVQHDDTAEVYKALVLGTRDYIRKNGFSHVVLGLSGGIDSSLVATIAADALGADAVTGVALPSPYSSEGSLTDAAALAENLGIELLRIPISDVYQAALSAMQDAFKGAQPNVAEENLQARVRGMLLMALSNKFNWIVLTTGNKSEMATGFSTLYGDMAGGFAVLKDVPKTLVYELSRWRNARGKTSVIPQVVIDKPPSAELRHGQKDTDTLPPYDVLDPILERYIEDEWGYRELVAHGFDPETVRKVIRLVETSEYKRRQAPPGVKITPRAFGKDRRLPITSKFRDEE
jgi:NAD+ synthase (glutamine-hydrolysing)